MNLLLALISEFFRELARIPPLLVRILLDEDGWWQDVEDAWPLAS